MKKIFAANWKLYKSPKETRTFLSELNEKSKDVQGEMIVFPSTISLEAAADVLKSSHISWGAQNCYSQTEGAYTGENSAAVVRELGAKYLLVGHSERRKIFKETDSDFAEKIALAQSLGLTPIYCIGETLEEREAMQTDQVNQKQLQIGLWKADLNKPLIVAYEPVWAIGTGKVATPEQVAVTHQKIHSLLETMKLGSTPLLYGGSVKPDNAGKLLPIPHVDGFLIGGASLELNSYLAICRAAVS